MVGRPNDFSIAVGVTCTHPEFSLSGVWPAAQSTLFKKLGVENLRDSFATSHDKKMADTIAPIATRLRLRTFALDACELVAEAKMNACPESKVDLLVHFPPPTHKTGKLQLSVKMALR